MTISVENRKIFPPLVFCAFAEGFPLEFGTGAGVRKLEWLGYRTDKKFDDILSHLDTMHQRDRRTDGQRTPGHSSACPSVRTYA